eukprot:GCRY01002007.1.p1 GENE.GCRY01002007.1~~GCRY01002007.1.p1  ORF type:complete len:227 (+),score=46.93 GCRY01002007.1:174-854(+)
MAKPKRWIPLESNPEVMNKYISSLGVKGWEFADVFSFDSEMLQFVPKPCCATLLLFPLTQKIEKKRSEKFQQSTPSKSVFFTKQTIGNACGTVGIIHAICNNTNKISLEDDGFFKSFLSETENLSPEKIAEKLENQSELESKHEESAAGGQTEAPDADESLILHFICFTEVDGVLYELDGRMAGVVSHGPCGSDEVLEKSAEIVKEYMAADPAESQFSLVALVKTD